MRYRSNPECSHLRWAQGYAEDGEGESEAGYDLACDDDEFDDEHDGREPSLGAPENHAGFPDQSHCSQGGAGHDVELDAAEDISRIARLPYDLVRLYREKAKEMGRAAVSLKRRLLQPGADGLHRPWVGAERVYGLRVSGDCRAPYILDGGAAHVDQE